MSNLSESLCREAIHIANATTPRIFFCVKGLFGLVGTFSVLMWHKHRSSAWLANPSARVLYNAHIYFTFHNSISFFGLFTFQVIKGVTQSEDPCFHVFDARWSCFLRLIPVTGIHAQSFTMFAFAFERGIATLYSAHYETYTKRYFGVLLVTLAVLAAILMDLFCSFLPTPPNTYVSGLSVKNASNAVSYQYANYIPFGLEFVTVGMFCFIYYVNVGKKLEGRLLGDKYQIAENKKIIRTLLPCFIIHFALNSSSYLGLFLYPVFFPKFDAITAIIWTEIFSQAQTYAFVLPPLLYWKTKTNTRVSTLDSRMSVINPILCAEATALALDVPLRVINCIKFSISVIGAIVVIVFHNKQGTGWIAHPNAKILYKGHIFLAFCVNCGFATIYGYQIIRTSLSSPDLCYYTINARYSAWFRTLPVAFIHTQTLNMLSLTLERVVSTLIPKWYEKITKPYLGFCLLAFSLMGAVCQDASFLMPIPGDVYVSGFTNKNRYNLQAYQISMYIPIAAELTSISTFSLILYWNSKKSKGRKEEHLGNKYQISENRRVIRALFPCFVVHFCLSIFSYVGLLAYPLFFPQFSVITSTTWVEIFGQAMMYSLLMPLIIFWQTRKRAKINIVNSEAATQAYFEQMKDLFENRRH